MLVFFVAYTLNSLTQILLELITVKFWYSLTLCAYVFCWISNLLKCLAVVETTNKITAERIQQRIRIRDPYSRKCSAIEVFPLAIVPRHLHASLLLWLTPFTLIYSNLVEIDHRKILLVSDTVCLCLLWQKFICLYFGFLQWDAWATDRRALEHTLYSSSYLY